jgi:hypothetical protein
MPKIFKAHKPKNRGLRPRPHRKEPSHDGKLPAEGTTAKPTGGASAKPKEIGGPSGPEPTRYGDWERKVICVDF